MGDPSFKDGISKQCVHLGRELYPCEQARALLLFSITIACPILSMSSNWYSFCVCSAVRTALQPAWPKQLKRFACACQCLSLASLRPYCKQSNSTWMTTTEASSMQTLNVLRFVHLIANIMARSDNHASRNAVDPSSCARPGRST